MGILCSLDSFDLFYLDLPAVIDYFAELVHKILNSSGY